MVARALNKGNLGLNGGAVDALGLTGSETVADIGFGGGVGLDLLLAALRDGGVVHGVDPSASMVERARRGHASAVDAGRLVLHQGTLEGLPLDDGVLDGWITLNTFYFVPDLLPAARELRRALGADGRGVVGIGDPDWMARQAFTQHGFLLRPVDDVASTLEDAGLAVERRTFGDVRADEPFHLLVCRPA